MFATLTSPRLIKAPGNLFCYLTFYYYMASTQNSLATYVNNKTGSHRIFHFLGNKGNQWNNANVKVETNSVYTVSFRMDTKDYNAYVAVDDIKFKGCYPG